MVGDQRGSLDGKRFLLMLLITSVLFVLQYENFQNLLFPSPYTVEKQKVYNYLHSHFNSSVGLIYESEDPSTQIIDGGNYSYNQIYWIYSDNLLVTWALK